MIRLKACGLIVLTTLLYPIKALHLHLLGRGCYTQYDLKWDTYDTIKYNLTLIKR